MLSGFFGAISTQTVVPRNIFSPPLWNIKYYSGSNGDTYWNLEATQFDCVSHPFSPRATVFRLQWICFFFSLPFFLLFTILEMLMELTDFGLFGEMER